MPEPVVPAPTNPNPAPAPAPAPNPAPAPPAPSGGDTPPKPAENMVPYERFKEVNDKLQSLTTAQAEAERKRLEEAGEHKTLAAQEKARADDLAKTVNTMRIETKVTQEAVKLGIVDIDAAIKLMDSSKLTVGSDGSVSGAEDALKALIAARPYLIDKANTTRIGSPTNPASPDANPGVKRFKHSEIKDPKFFRENEKEIMQAMKLGLVEDDLPRQ